MTRRWRQPLDDTEQRPLFNGVKDNVMSHPGYSGRTSQTTPPSIRIGLRVACSPIAPSHPTTSEIRRAFLRALDLPAIADLVASLTDGEDLAWTSWDSTGRHNHGAVLGGGQDDIAPTAWARILLPEPGRSSFWTDPRCADFVLHIEPRTRQGRLSAARGLSSWHRSFVKALTLPDAIAASLLTGELGLDTPDQPSATAAVWLTAPHDLTELVDINGLQRLTGSHLSSWFHGYAVADESGGQRQSVAATDWIRRMCDDALHLDGYEPLLLAFSDG